ncbi:hypothetical protein HNR23_000584 [Nocardiopsis mwathae]|uniref:TPR repeat domain-containing protein n=1 Tax=Nocardiopsis mwathae TaxID=1472723 RepID=A0A7X0D4X7_9ACTN|nr:hypothetical protein [Nocardiopsis mwathae]MBB6170524.1 hypothetical protein [Nocardiopsis mwathae]
MLEFTYEEPDATDGDVDDAAETLWKVFDRITGGSSAVRENFGSSAMEFSEIVSDDIKNTGSYNELKWKEAAMAASYAAGVTAKWADDLRWYDRKIKILEAEHLTLKASFALTIGPMVLAGKEKEHTNKFNEQVGDLNSKARAYWKELEGKSDDCGNRLKEGVTPSSVKKLMEGGRLGWIPYNLIGSDAPTPVTPEQGKKMAREMERYLSGEKEIDENYYAIKAALEAIGARARDKQGSGERLTKNENEFLSEFLNRLDQFDETSVANPRAQGVIGIPDYLDALANEGRWDSAETEALLGALGGAILALSDESLGGSYNQLPESVQKIFEGSSAYEDSTPYTHYGAPGGSPTGEQSSANEWYKSVDSLTRMLSSAPEITGGKHFSAGLTMTVGMELDDHFNRPDSKFELLGSPQASQSLEELLGITARNKEASAAVFTGYQDGILDNPDTEKMVRGLFRYEWDDNGEAARGLTDWISNDINDPFDVDKRKLAGDAAASLIKVISSDEMFDALVDTGIEVGDGYGEGNASFTQYNSELADSLFKLFESRVDDFGMSYPDGAYEFEPGVPSDYSEEKGYYNDQSKLRLDPRARVRFLQYLMGDEDTAVNTVGLAKAKQFEAMDSYIGGGPEYLGARAGRLQSLVDSAVINEAFSRYGNVEDAFEREKELNKRGGEAAIDLFLGSVPGGGVGSSLAGLTKASYQDFLNDYYDDRKPTIERSYQGQELADRAEDSMRLDAELQMIHMLTAAGKLDANDIESSLDRNLEGDGSGSVIWKSPGKDLISSPGKLDREDYEVANHDISKVLDEVRVEQQSGRNSYEYAGDSDISGDKASDLVDTYVGEQWKSYENYSKRFMSKNVEDYKKFHDGDDINGLYAKDDD